MKRLFVFAIALSVAAMASQPAWAQRGRGGGFGGRGGLGLLAQQSVQDELKLSGDQVKQVTEQMEKQRESLAGLQDLSREERQTKFAERQKAGQEMLAKVLNPDQLKRFKQIDLQQRGAQALADPEVATSLGLTAEQVQSVASIQEAMRGEMREAFQAGGGGDRAEARKKLEALQNTTNEKLKALLTPDQQTKWKELSGEPFKGEIRRPQPRGGNRPAGAGRGAGANRNVQADAPGRFFQLASFAAGDDDDTNQARRPEDSAARRDERRRNFSARPGGPNAEIWSRVAAAVDDGPRWRGRGPSWARHYGHHGRGAGWRGRTYHGQRFVEHGRRPDGRGPNFAWHRDHGGHGPSMAQAPGFGRHHGPPPPFAHYRGHGPAHFAVDRGPHGHGHHFASWHRRPDGGPSHFDRHRHDGDRRPPMPPGPPDHRRGELDERGAQASVERLAQLERSLDGLAEQLENLRRELRR